MAENIKMEEIRQLIESGRASLAQRKLQALAKTKLPRTQHLQIASFARRANLPGLAIRILNPVVRPAPKSPKKATAQEKAEYAASLIRIGAIQEALSILRALDAEAHPEALLFEAFALFAQWEYQAATPLLTRYIESPFLDDYQRFVGKVNLAATLVHQKWDPRAGVVLEELRREAQAQHFQRLYGNTLELSAQFELFHRRWKRAEKFLEKAHQALKQTGGLDLFFVRKWQSICDALKPGNKAKTKFDRTRREAKSLRHWETLRDCDLFEGIVTKNEALLTHLYYGTPFEGYRQRIFSEYGHPLVIPSLYTWNLSGKSKENIILDLQSGEITNNKAKLRPGQIPYRLLSILASDFYHPFRLAALHAQLFPQEYFNPDTSPMRVHQIIKRLKQWFTDHKTPLRIQEEGGTYSLVATGNVALRIPRQKVPLEESVLLLKKLTDYFGQNEFSTLEATQFLKTSSRSTLRLLKKAKEEGILEQRGKGPSTRYQLAKI